MEFVATPLHEFSAVIEKDSMIAEAQVSVCKSQIFGIPLFDDEEVNNDTCEELSNGRGEDDE